MVEFAVCDRKYNSFPADLNGGQKQRVAIMMTNCLHLHDKHCLGVGYPALLRSLEVALFRLAFQLRTFGLCGYTPRADGGRG